MSEEIYDVGIIGAGVAGAFATLKMSQEDAKCLVIDSGKAPLKRRHQIHGWLGCFPNGDGKLYLNNLEDLADITNNKNAKSSFLEVKSIFKDINNFKVIKDSAPLSSLSKRLGKAGYEITTNDYIQTIPKEVHMLSKFLVKELDKSKKIDYVFEEEIIDIVKNKKIFHIYTEDQEFKCRKIILSVGRGGWRLAHKIYSKFGLVTKNNIARYGIRIETDAVNLKDFNESNCSIIKKDKWSIGPLCWNGSIIPEDHDDFASTAFRSNEPRWNSEKVSFNLIGNIPVNNDAVEQIDRIAKLTFLIANDRVLKERLSNIINKKSKLSIMKEYNWLVECLQELDELIPNLISKSYFHFPTILPLTSSININKNLETDLDGMYVAGESAGLHGILSAACSGLLAAKNIIK